MAISDHRTKGQSGSTESQRPVLRTFASGEEFNRYLLEGANGPATPDDVPRFKLGGPPATKEQILAAYAEAKRAAALAGGR